MKVTIEFDSTKINKLKKSFNNVKDSFMFIATVSFLVCSILYFGEEGEWLTVFVGLVSAYSFFYLLCDTSKMQKKINNLEVERDVCINKVSR